jgi:serine/threonine protein kinase
MTITAGTKLGRYEIRSKIGEGGMGEVYLAQDTKLNRRVAIKFLPLIHKPMIKQTNDCYAKRRLRRNLIIRTSARCMKLRKKTNTASS